MLNWQSLAIGFVLGLIPAVSYVMGWRSHKNVEVFGTVAPKLRQVFGRKHEIVVNTPEREYELEQERLEEEAFDGSTADLAPESY